MWLSLVYLTFERVGYESKRTGGFLGQSVAADLRQKFHTFTVSAPLPPPPLPPLGVCALPDAVAAAAAAAGGAPACAAASLSTDCRKHC